MGVNPVFTAPRAWKVRDAFAKVPFIVSFGSFLDETSVLADLILPDHSFLESWSEAVPESGSATAVVSMAPAVMKPLHETRATPDVLLEIGRAAREARRSAVADVRGDADGDVCDAAGDDGRQRCVDRRPGKGRVVGEAASGVVSGLSADRTPRSG